MLEKIWFAIFCCIDCIQELQTQVQYCAVFFLLTAGDSSGAGGDCVCPWGLVACGSEFRQYHRSHSELL